MTSPFATVAAYPLGRPVGVDRYGLTYELARLYRAIVNGFDEDGRMPTFEALTAATGLGGGHRGSIHTMVSELVDRGWLVRGAWRSSYDLVDPVMRFARVPELHECPRSAGGKIGHTKRRSAASAPRPAPPRAASTAARPASPSPAIAGGERQ